MSFAIAILGLALLILVHEAGHFFASLAVGLRPRKFYVGFPPPIVRTTRKGIEYGVGMIPLGGFVSIPGMHRPIRLTPSADSREQSPRRRRSPARSIASSERWRSRTSRVRCPELMSSIRRCERRRCRLAPMLLPRKV